MPEVRQNGQPGFDRSRDSVQGFGVVRHRLWGEESRNGGWQQRRFEFDRRVRFGEDRFRENLIRKEKCGKDSV